MIMVVLVNTSQLTCGSAKEGIGWTLHNKLNTTPSIWLNEMLFYSWRPNYWNCQHMWDNDGSTLTSHRRIMWIRITPFINIWKRMSRRQMWWQCFKWYTKIFHCRPNVWRCSKTMDLAIRDAFQISCCLRRCGSSLSGANLSTRPCFIMVSHRTIMKVYYLAFNS